MTRRASSQFLDRMSMRFLNSAMDWGEKKHVQMHVNRNETGDWYVRLMLNDARGSFGATVVEPIDKKYAADEDDEAFAVRVGKMLDDACLRARHARIVSFNGRDPRSQIAVGRAS